MAIKFTATMYVTAYQLARQGMTNAQIAATLGVAGRTFKEWQKRRPAFVDALTRGRAGGVKGNEFTFRDYVYQQLSPAMQETWNDINRCDMEKNGIERIEALLHNGGVRARQHFFIYALSESLFNVSQSLRKLNISRKTFESWCRNDAEFAELIDEIHWHKKNYLESAFMGRVAAGDTTAIIHGVKTQLRDRGYNEKIEIEHTGTVDVNAQVSVTIEELNLPLDTRKIVLDALRQRQAALSGVGENN